MNNNCKQVLNSALAQVASENRQKKKKKINKLHHAETRKNHLIRVHHQQQFVSSQSH